MVVLRYFVAVPLAQPASARTPPGRRWLSRCGWRTVNMESLRWWWPSVTRGEPSALQTPSRPWTLCGFQSRPF